MVQLTLSGEPDSIRASGVLWNTFGGDAGTALTDINGLQTDEVKGQELVDLVRTYKEDLPPRLQRVQDAWTKVGAALTTYAGTLQSLQTRMQAVAIRHGNQQTTVNNANAALGSARQADSTHAQSRKSQQQQLKPGETLPSDSYVSQVGAKQTALTNAKNALTQIEGEAAQIHREHEEAVRRLTGEINTAKGLRPDDPPNLLQAAWQGFKDFVANNADVLKQISGVLKIVSAVAGLLAFIPVLAPIMGPIALVTGAAALLIDVSVKLVTGQGSWADIGIDAIGMIPGGRIAGALAKGGKAFKAAETAADGKKIIDSAKRVGDFSVSAAGVAATGAAAATGWDGSKKTWGDVFVKALGIKGVTKGKGVNIQNFVEGVASSGNQAVKNGLKMMNDEKVSAAEWVGMFTGFGKAGIAARRSYVYRNEGTHPDGSPRSAGENPKYTIKDTAKAGLQRLPSSVQTRVAEIAVARMLNRGPVEAPAPPPTTSIHGPRTPGPSSQPAPPLH
ncbi:hypothetical protein [Nakamurella aerolata]|uniref:Uncharacterized protein n=1 Tax=Nakamurella aerolata TaxID=1656892 RepID=A0A849AIX6_9ACTN|nr:hypothetical protein [Nakamurella aerolata]NNG36752.1 hypothetical protein [Nakamurella aerolata]